jgi:hypothetical protein
MIEPSLAHPEVIPGRPDITSINWDRMTRWSYDDGGRDYPSGWDTEDYDPENIWLSLEDEARVEFGTLSAEEQAAVMKVIEAYQETHEAEPPEPEDPPEGDPYEREWRRQHKGDY